MKWKLVKVEKIFCTSCRDYREFVKLKIKRKSFKGYYIEDYICLNCGQLKIITKEIRP